MISIRSTVRTVFAIACTGALLAQAPAGIPDHPVITEVYTDPIGLTDGPIGRDPTSLHQEFIELYVPPAAALDPLLNKDSLKLTFYEVEGDNLSSGLGLLNYRFDLPPLDLDPNNGLTLGALPRPDSGVIVLGWVDYFDAVPTALAGDPNSRVALIDGGVTSTSGFTFIAINGNQFGGTTNFATLAAESLIDVPSETFSGIVQNGSGVYLLVNRDAPGYVELFDDKHVPVGGSADPDLAGGTVLQTGALLDGFAVNDHGRFDALLQPYITPTGRDIDLETVLPLGGVYSLLTPQVGEDDNRPLTRGIANGYGRVFPDVAKTTENLSPLDDDPIADALNAYRRVRHAGPFYPSPGFVALTTTPPQLSVAAATEQLFTVLSETVGRPAILTANIGGNFGIDLNAVPGASSNPAVATFAASDPDPSVLGQGIGLPAIEITPDVAALDGQSASATVTITAIKSNALDPDVLAPVQAVTFTATVLDPTVGRDPNGMPLQATVFAAIQPVVSDPLVANELLGTDFGAFLSANLGALARDWHANGPALIDPLTNLADPNLIRPMVQEFPDVPFQHLNVAGPPGRLDLADTLLTSAEFATGLGTYDDSFIIVNDPNDPNDPNKVLLRAFSVNVPDTITFGGSFNPSERVFFVDPKGFVGNPRSGLSNATTSRTFEVALFDTNLRLDGTLETGRTDDFGVMVEVLDVEAGAPVVPGEFVFLSFTGGIQGADIDTMEVRPGVATVGTLIYLDLDNLHDVLGIRSIERLFLVDAGKAGPEVDIVDAFSLNPVTVLTPCPGDADGDRDVDLSDLAAVLANFGLPSGATQAQGDVDFDGDVDLSDLALVLANFGLTCP